MGSGSGGNNSEEKNIMKGSYMRTWKQAWQICNSISVNHTSRKNCSNSRTKLKHAKNQTVSVVTFLSEFERVHRKTREARTPLDSPTMGTKQEF